MKIIKRDGAEKNFDISKIVNAISKANKEILEENERLPDQNITDIANYVKSICESSTRSLNVEEIQDIVEERIMFYNAYKVARAYINYRYKRSLLRKANTTDESILNIVDLSNEEIKQENSNKNPIINSTQRDYISGEVSKDITMRKLLPKEIVEAHENGIIHFHDSDYFLQHMHNCCLVNLEDMLQNGTCISDTLIEKPHSFSVACNISTQIIAQVASNQFGGQSINLSHLAPFVNVSRIKIKKEIIKEYESIGLSVDEEKINKIVELRVKEEIRRGVQTIQYQILTLLTTNGQTPFITIFMYLGELTDSQTKNDLAMIIEEVIDQRYHGVKNDQGVYITPSFPKLIYVLEEDNIHKDSKYYYLTEKAAKCTAKRMVPDYISEKKMKEIKEGNVFSSMGCVDGDETIKYSLPDGTVNNKQFEDVWNELAKLFEIKHQFSEDNPNLYIDLKGIKIYDNHLRKMVDCYRIIRNVSSKWCIAKFENGMSLKCTVDHPFEIIDKGVIFAKDLSAGDTTYIGDKEISAVDYIEFLDDYKNFSYDVTTESEHFEVSGIYSHNCRSFLAPWYQSDGGVKFWGRFNMGVVTINLPDVACSSYGDFDKFWKIFDERLELCFKALMCRYERLKGTPSDVAPILWQYGALARLEKGEPIDKLLTGGYASISLGYAGLAECVHRMTGLSHTDPEATPFALNVMKYMNDKVTEWKEKTNLGFSIYGTPIESTTYKFAKCLQKRFGKIPGVTDKNYITNSYHVHVTEKIDAFTKLKFESQFQDLSSGGAISYVEVPNMQDNVDAVISVMQFIYDNIMYAELNTKSDYCQVCGYDGEIKIIEDEDSKLIWECPKCGNRDQNKMSVARRTCGYIGTQFWNQGRTAEIKERVLHL